MDNAWLINLQENIENIMEKIPEIFSPGITYIAGVPFIGGDEFAVLAGLYYANKTNCKVLIFTFDFDEFVEYCKLDVEKIILENKNLHVLEAIDESYISKDFEKYSNPEMIILIVPLRLQRDDFFEGQLSCEEVYWMGDTIKLHYVYFDEENHKITGVDTSL